MIIKRAWLRHRRNILFSNRVILCHIFRKAENIYEMSCVGKIEGGKISREEQDAYSISSYKRAALALQFLIANLAHLRLKY